MASRQSSSAGAFNRSGKPAQREANEVLSGCADVGRSKSDECEPVAYGDRRSASRFAERAVRFEGRHEVARAAARAGGAWRGLGVIPAAW